MNLGIDFMRLLFACLALLPGPALADVYTLNSAPIAATIYALGAKVQRALTVNVAQGAHQVILPGLPAEMDDQMMRVSVSGAALGATQFRRDAVPPQPQNDSPAIITAKAGIEDAKAALRDLDDQIATARLAGRAAQARIGFLGELGRNAGLAAEVNTLRDLGRMIGSESLSAQQDALSAEQSARDLELTREDLEKNLKNAEAALRALTPPAEKMAQLTLDITAPAAGDVTISLEYFVMAYWQPTYDIHLNTGDTPGLNIRRSAVLAQESGENWDNVTLTLSTFALSNQMEPSPVFERRLSLIDRQPLLAKGARQMSDSAVGYVGEPSIAAPIMIEDVASASFDGPGVTYTLPAPVDVASGVDQIRVALDSLSFPARQFARAVPRSDATAFLMADFTNTTKEPLLRADTATLFLDNTLIGQIGFDQIPAGAKAELPFGPIEDLRLSDTILDQSEGDRGIISRSNGKSEITRLDIQNIGAKDWQVEVLSAVPYTSQEDLEIDWSAVPAPDQINVDDQRGILQWRIDVAAGRTESINIKEDLNWPSDKVLR
jgi:uncharacterized protein (TIGR02231 family)